jgi:glutamate synthase domain-containing protein 2
MPDGTRRPQEVARYIAEISTELREMAHGAGFSFLAHLLSMVVVQAGKHHPADEQEFRRRVSGSVE